MTSATFQIALEGFDEVMLIKRLSCSNAQELYNLVEHYLHFGYIQVSTFPANPQLVDKYNSIMIRIIPKDWVEKVETDEIPEM